MKRILLGIASVIPLIYLLAILLTPLKDILSMDIFDPSTPQWVLYVIAFHFAMFLFYAMLLAYYFTHMLGNQKIKKEEKALWVIGFIFFGFVAMPLYWFLRFRE